jgi:hydrogenase 3 maturation protease
LNDLAQRFLELLNPETSSEASRSPLIISVGNVLKGDDGVGVALLNRLKDKVDAEFLDCGIAPENFLEKIVSLHPRILVVIDAVDFREAPGSMRIVRAEELAEGGLSTHSLSPSLFIEYLETRLKGLRVFVLGIQPGNCTLGESLSSEIVEALDHFMESL